MFTLTACLWTLIPAAALAPHSGKYFKIMVVDDQTGGGVPLVELRTVNNIRLLTDSNGIAAFYEPGLMKQKVFFHVRSHGYEFPKDGFGYRGKALQVIEGGSARLTIRRINIAQRLYRVTGGGIYRDSLLTGHKVPTKHPVLNGLVLGSDSVVTTVYHGKLYWFWGDTNWPAYPLGNFHTPGATSPLPGKGILDPEAGIDLSYFVGDKGFAKPMAPLPGKGPTWIRGLVTLRDSKGRERMFAAYAKVHEPMTIYERGLVEFNDQKRRFEKVVRFPKDAPLYPDGHPFLHKVDGVKYIYFADPYPLVRVRADPDQLQRLSNYEAFTCLQPGGGPGQDRLDHNKDGSLRYAWKKNTPAVGPATQARLIRRKLLKPAEALLHLQDADTGKPISDHRGSVYWNAYRQRWVMIAVQNFGTSVLGEVWYAEADTPLGPWVYARKIVTHDRYSFYNPKQHPEFDKAGGREIFFEGTYSQSFSGNPEPTPRYDYNQIMYKLDLADHRLVLPAPIYQLSEKTPERFGNQASRPRGDKSRRVAFFALDRPVKGSVPVYESRKDGSHWSLTLEAPRKGSKDDKPTPLFFALAPDTKQRPATTVPLYEYVHRDGRPAYRIDGSWSKPGYKKSKQPLCIVWRSPMSETIIGE
jgi:hypothetical protein